MMRNPSTHDVDIAVLGSGASGTHGLLRTISELRDRRTPFDDPIRITVIDRDEAVSFRHPLWSPIRPLLAADLRVGEFPA